MKSATSICLFLDENVDQRIVEGLIGRDIPTHTVEEQGLKGERDDSRILERATELGCVLVTNDSDFFEISREINESYATDETKVHAPIIYITSPKSPGAIIRELILFRDEKDYEESLNQIFYI